MYTGMLSTSSVLFHSTTKILALAAIFVSLAVAGALLDFGLTQGLLTPADAGDPGIFPGLPETASFPTDIMKYAALLSEAEKTHPRVSAESLADVYDRGGGVAPSPVVAAIFIWRADHDNYFGLCDGDDGCGRAHANALRKKINTELSDADRLTTSEIVALRYPNLVRRYRLSYLIHAAVMALMVSIFGGVCWRFYRQQ